MIAKWLLVIEHILSTIYKRIKLFWPACPKSLPRCGLRLAVLRYIFRLLAVYVCLLANI